MKDLDTICPANQSEWREWLLKNHQTKQSIWVIYHKKETKIPSMSWSDAVDEALCFGWIDSTRKTIDSQKFIQLFSKRKAQSTWSKINKEKIKKLVAAGSITKAGLEIIEIAKQNGSWTILDTVEELLIPDDLEKAFDANQNSKSYFLSLNKSTKKAILQWLVLAKRAETRQKRIIEIAELAAKKQKPKQF